jgi:hypothetical protein
MARNLLVDDEPVSRPRNLLADEVPIPRQQPDIKDGEGPDRRFDVGKIPESGVYGFLGGLAAPTAYEIWRQSIADVADWTACCWNAWAWHGG